MINQIIEACDLSISIVNYNSTRLTIGLINSIVKHVKNIKYEILISDNASSDFVDTIYRYHPEVKIIYNSKNLYFTKADNQNLSCAKGKYILSINPDTLVLENTIQNMIKFLDENPEVGAVTPKFIYPDGTLQSSIGYFVTFIYGVYEFSGINYLFPNNKVNRSINQPKVIYDQSKQQEATVLYGACIMIRREVLETVGLKDENLVHGWDEYDWCKRISENGWKLYYIPDSVIIHYRGATRDNINKHGFKDNSLDKYHINGLLYLYKKHFGTTKYIFLKLLLCFKTTILYPMLIAKRLLIHNRLNILK